MDYDNQKALKIFYELRSELQKSDETTKLKQLNQIISVLESSFFNKVVGIHKSLEALKHQKNLKPEDIQVDAENGVLKIEKLHKSNSKECLDKPIISPKPKKLVLSDEELKIRLQKLCGNRELLHIQLSKESVSQTLGFSIKCSGSLHANGIFIEDVAVGTIGEKSGIKRYDQIIAVNGTPLDDPDTNRDIALQALKSNHLRIDLYLARDVSKNTLAIAKEYGHTRNRSDIGLTRELSTEWTQYEIIDLKSFNGSFGFGIMGGLTSEVMVRNILNGGAADMDGRIQIDDHIMYINDISVRHLSSNQVAEILKNQVSEVKLIVARPFDQTTSSTNTGKVQMVETVNLDSRLEMIVNQLYPDNIHVRSNTSIDDYELPLSTNDKLNDEVESDDKMEHIQIDLMRPTKNLGMTLLALTNQNYIDGIYVNNVIPGSPADKYNFKKFDRIIKVNDEFIDIDKTESVIHEILNFSPMSFYIRRYTSGPTFEKLQSLGLFYNSPNDSKGFNNSIVKTMRTPLLSESSEELSGSDFEVKDQHQRKPLSLEEKLQLITKWKKRIDGNREIIIAEFSKFTEDGGLGISLEGTVDVEDNGLEVHPHHYIRSITPNGPAGRNGFLKVKDELLEANDKRIYGLNHLEAVNVLKNLPLSVRIVVARAVPVDSNCFLDDEVSEEADRLCQDLDDIIARETGSGSLYSIKAKSQDNIDDWPLQEGKLSEEASRSRSLDQVHGLAIWDRQVTYVDLEKRSNGLGFSVLDYQDPVDPQQSVIVIRSLVPNGAASKDGRIFPGDRLMSVNNIDVSRANMTEAVEALKKTEPGIVRLGIVKALCLESDNNQDTSLINYNFEEELEDPINEFDQVSLFDRISYANPSWSDSCSSNVDFITDQYQYSDMYHINKPFQDFIQSSSGNPKDLISFTTPSYKYNSAWVIFDNGFETINDCNLYENVSSPKLLDEIDSEINNIDEDSIAPIPEALEHKIRIHKLSGQRLGFHLESDKLSSGNENGFVITSIDVGSPAHKCNRLSVGDYVTKIDNVSIRQSSEAEVKAILKSITSYSDDIKVNFIPEADYQVFMQSKTIQTNYKAKLKSEISLKIETEAEFSGFFPKPSVIKASGGKLIFSNVDNTVKEVIKRRESKEVKCNVENHPRSRVSSLVEIYDGIWGEELNVNLNRLDNDKFGLEIVGGFNENSGPDSLQGFFISDVTREKDNSEIKVGDMIVKINNVSILNHSLDDIGKMIELSGNEILLHYRALLPKILGSDQNGNSEFQNVQLIHTVKMTSEFEPPKSIYMPPANQLNDANSVLSMSSKQNNEENILKSNEIKIDLPETNENKDKILQKPEDEDHFIELEKEKVLMILDRSTEGNDDENSEKSIEILENNIDEKLEYSENKETSIEQPPVDDVTAGINPVSPTEGGIQHSESISVKSDNPNVKNLTVDEKDDNLDDEEVNDDDDDNSKRLANKYGDLGGELILLNIPNPRLSNCSLGLKLTGNKDLNHMNIFICQIVPNSITDIDGRLQVGDEILEVDDHILFGRSHLNATPIIRSCSGKLIKFVIHRSNEWQSKMAVPITIRCADEIQSVVSSRRESVVDCLSAIPDQNNSRKASSVSLGQIPYIPSISTEETHIVYLSKNAQGLGFAIMEGSFTNETGIYIKHLAVQGPAIQEGSLRPGDKLISVNHQDVSNASYDMVLELLKNVKNQVRLVVARVRCSNSPSHSVGSPIHNHYPKRLSAPHITALPYYNRPKSPTIQEEKSELSSPGILIKLSPESESGLATLAKSMSDANSRRRSSVTNTQSMDIVNVLLNNMEDDEKVENICIKRNEDALGISIIGGSDTFIGDVIVHDIFPNGAVSKDGRIKVGDRILTINEIQLLNKTNEEIITMLHETGAELHLKIRHEDTPIPDQDIYEVVSTVELTKKPSKGLGISIIGREGAKSVYICDVVKGGVADVDGRLKPGDQILEINGEDFRNETQEVAATRLKGLMGQIVFKIGRIQQLKQHYTPSYLVAKDDNDDNSRTLGKGFSANGHGHSPARSPLASPAHAR